MQMNHKDDLMEATLQNYKFMKSMLGHITIVDNTIINPVPIYCVSYSSNDEMIFTGDNNGLIKIWSTLTGQLIDVFKYHDKPVNDILLIKDFLISCSEDQTMVIWDTKFLQLKKIYNFDESIVRVVDYEYSLHSIVHHVIIASSLSGKLYIIDLNEEIQNNFSNDEESFPTKIYFDKQIIEKYELKKIKSIHQTSTVANNQCGILISGFSDGLMSVWDIQTILDDHFKKHKFIHEFEKYVIFLEYVHNSVIHLSEFSTNNDYFITGSMDGNVLVWLVRKDKLINIRNIRNSNKTMTPYEFPIYCVSTISESEDRTRCNVNVVIWTKNSNYVVAIISSKQRKRIIDKNKDSNHNINTNHEQPEDNSHSSKRTSSLIVYSIHSKKIIRKYNEQNGFNCHDECFVLESHPIFENVILTISGMNHIILFNFISGTIIKQFVENNYFFTNISQNIIASEGKFSSKGDSFVITTFLGFISIFSIYSKNSFSTTYMNQFTSKEFSNNSSIIQSNNDSISLNSLFPQNVNMYNLPYIVEAPYSHIKLLQIESLKSLIQKKYNMTENEINQRYLRNNYEHYALNYNDRRIECEKEEKAFEQSEQDNMNYRIAEENETNELPEEGEDSLNDLSYQSEWNNNNLNDEEQDIPEEELSDEEKDDVKESRDEISVHSSTGNYFLRSRNNNSSIPKRQRTGGIHTRSYYRINRNTSNNESNISKIIDDELFSEENEESIVEEESEKEEEKSNHSNSGKYYLRNQKNKSNNRMNQDEINEEIIHTRSYYRKNQKQKQEEHKENNYFDNNNIEQNESLLKKKRTRDAIDDEFNCVENSNQRSQRSLRKRTERKNLNLNYLFGEAEPGKKKKNRTKKKLIKRMKSRNNQESNVNHNIVSFHLEESEEKEST